MGVTMTESTLRGRCGQLKPFLPARPAGRQASRSAVRCTASSEENAGAFVYRRAALLGLLGLGLAADAQAASNPLAQKKDPYMELQSIVKGRGGSGSLLDTLKVSSKGSPDIVQKGIIAPFTGSPQSQSSAFGKKPALPKAGGPNIELIGGVAALGVIGAITASQSGGGSKAAPKSPALGTQRIGASAKQAAKKVQKAAPKAIAGTKRISAPVKPKAPSAGGTGLFGMQRPSAGTAKQAVSKAVSKAAPKQATQKAKQLPQKAKQVQKQVPQKARQVGKQVGRAAQQAAPDGFKGALKDQDTLANLGAGALVGLVVLIAASVTSGAPQEVAKPIERAAKEAVKDVKAAVKGGPQASTPKSASKDLKSAVKEAPKVLDKVTPQAPSLPKLPNPVKEAPKALDKVTPSQAPSLPKLPAPPSAPSLPKPSLPTPPSVPSTPPPVQAEKPKVPSGPDLIPDAVRKPTTPKGPPPPAFPKPTTPSGPNTFKLPPSSIQDKKPSATPGKGPTASIAQAPTSSAPNSNIAGAVVALAALGLAAAATANSKQQADGPAPGASSGAASPQTGSLTPSPGGAGTSDDNSEEGIKKRKDAARKWIDEWRAAQK